MKLRIIGTGSRFSRHPQIPPCFLIETEGSYIAIGAPHQLPARLGALGIPLDKLSMVVPLSDSHGQIGGLDEIGYFFYSSESKPYLTAPAHLLEKVMTRLDFGLGFNPRAVTKISFKEEHISETFTFISMGDSYGFKLEGAKIFVSGPSQLSEEILTDNMDCEIIMHECTLRQHMDVPHLEELTTLPVYLQKKMWLYGVDAPDCSIMPLPMIYAPQGAYIYDSDRRDKHMSKERFVRENSKRILGQV